jgi:hypothetical protein
MHQLFAGMSILPEWEYLPAKDKTFVPPNVISNSFLTNLHFQMAAEGDG